MSLFVQRFKLHFKLYWRLWFSIFLILAILAGFVGWKYYQNNVTSVKNADSINKSIIYYNQKNFEFFEKQDNFTQVFGVSFEELSEENALLVSSFLKDWQVDFEKLNTIDTTKNLSELLQSDLQSKRELFLVESEILETKICLKKYQEIENKNFDIMEVSVLNFNKSSSTNFEADKWFENFDKTYNDNLDNIKKYLECHSSSNIDDEINNREQFYLELKAKKDSFEKSYYARNDKSYTHYSVLVDYLENYESFEQSDFYIEYNNEKTKYINQSLLAIESGYSKIEGELKLVRDKYNLD